MDNPTGNISTILKFVYMIIAPYIVQYMTEDQFLVIGTAVVGLVIAVVDAYYPNTFKFLGNAPEPMETEEVVMNDEYEF